MDLGGLVGRTEEVALLSGLVTGLATGTGGTVLIEGEPGIGKTALVESCLTEATRHGYAVARAAGDELVRRFPLRVLLDAFDIEPGSADPRRRAVAEILRGAAPGRLAAAGDPVAAAAEGLLGLVERLCAESPLVLTIDDIQWVDEASLALWRRLAQLTDQLPLLLVAAFRPVPRRDEVDAIRQTVRANGHLITLEPLPAADVDHLVTRLVGAAPDPALRGVLASAAGNPLWLTEIVDALTRERAVAVTGPTAGLALPGYQPPASLFAAVSRRLTFLSAPATEVMRIAALLGAEFSVVAVATVLGRDPSDLMAAFDEAMAAGVASEVGDRLGFRHPLIREALYEEMSGAVRSGLHRHAARALADAGASPMAVATQLAAAGGRADQWQVEWLTRHAPALVNQSLEVGVELLRRAVEASDDPTSGVPAGDAEELAAVLARALFQFSLLDEAEQRARQVLARTADPNRAAEMREILSDLLLRATRADDSVVMAREGLDHPGLAPAWRARLLAQYAAVQMAGLGDLDAAEVSARQAAELGSAAHDRYAVGSAMLWLAGVSSYRGAPAAMLDYLERGLAAVGDDPECLRIRLLLLYNHVFALQLLDRLTEAAQAGRVARDVAEQTGSATMQRAHSIVGMLAFALGQWDDALAELDVVAESAAADMALMSRGIAALIAGRRDDRELAAAELKPIADLAHSTPELRNNGGYALAARSLAAEQSGDAPAALAILATMWQPEYSVMDYRHQFLADLVRLALATGDRAVAEAAVGTAEADAQRAPTPGLSAALGRGRGLLTGDPAAVLTAADHYRGCGRIPELASTLEDAAVLLAAAGETEPARAAFHEAVAHYTDLGATWDVRRADARLRPYGIRRGVRGPRRRPAQGWAALSPTELTVARLVGVGKSNPDIAADLLLSRRTVQTHVSHILVKLGVRSRVEIAREVARYAGVG